LNLRVVALAAIALCAGCSAFNPDVGALRDDAGGDAGSPTCARPPPPPVDSGDGYLGYQGTAPTTADAGTCGDAS
jgi:hypothetical protein